MSNAAKVVLGCGIGCAVVVVLAGVAVLVGLWWTLDPGRQVATRSVVGEDSVAALHYSDVGGGAGLPLLLEHVLEEVQRLQSEHRQTRLPEALRWLEQLQAQQRRADAESLLMWVPFEATLTVEQHETEPVLLVAANFRILVRVVRAVLMGVLRSEEAPDKVEILTRGDYEIVVLGGDVALCFVGGTVLVGSDPLLIERAIERIDSPPAEAAAPGEVLGQLHAVAEQWPVAGVVDNRDGFLEDLRQRRAAPCPPPAEAPPGDQVEPAAVDDELQARLAGLDWIWFGARIASSDRAEAEAVLELADGAEAIAWVEYLGHELERASHRLAERGMTLDHSIEVEGESLTLSLRADGLEAAVDRALAELFDEM